MSEIKLRTEYFLGANSAEGFVSLYDWWVDQRTIQAYYTIKGGAGCGKSTLMGKVAARMEQEGYEVEYIRCSGDPDSLDGIHSGKRSGHGRWDFSSCHGPVLHWGLRPLYRPGRGL